MPRPRRHALLAKLAPPRIPAELRRERLFASLAHQRSRTVVWICGPPGAGKTSLAAGYLADSRTASVWYQIDRGDSDPASFFHYLALALPADAARPPLPALTPEYLPDLDGFSRRFFRDAFTRLPQGAVLVLDNYQEAAADCAFHAVIAIAVDELPPGMNLLVLSRNLPPPTFVRHAASARMASVGWDELKLTLDETGAIARSNGVSDEATARRLHAQSGGWAGGLRLLLEELRRSGSVSTAHDAHSLDTVFDYFAEQVFAAMPTRLQDFLLRTHMLPRMTAAIAQELSGEPTAQSLLEDLYRRHLFTDRRVTEQVSYQYHALFRAFLAARAKDRLDQGERMQLHRRAAMLLERCALPEEALEVYQAAGEWQAVARLVAQHGARLLAQGRGATLRGWIEALPDEHMSRNAEPPYWLGTSLIAIDQKRAKAALEQAYRLYAQLGDVDGQLRTTAGIIETHFLQHSNHRLIDPWLPVHERLLAQVRPDMPAQTQLRAFATMLIALLYRQPDNAMLEVCAQRVAVLLESAEVAADARMVAATFLAWYCGYTGDFKTLRRLAPLGAALAAQAQVTPLHRANWWAWLGYGQHCMLDDISAQATLAPALELGLADNLPAVVFLSSYFLGLVAARLGKQMLANECLRRMEAMADAKSHIQRAILHSYRGWLAVERQQPAEALREGELAWEIGSELSSPSYLVHWGTPMLYGLVEARRFAQARQRLSQQREALRGTRIRCFEPMLLGIEAILALREGDAALARSLAAQSFRLAREHEHFGYLRRIRPWLMDLAALVLPLETDASYVRDFILQARIDPPGQAAHRWPWHCRIRTLGRFEINVDGRLVEFGRKTPKKPLALLRALICAGREGAGEDALCDLLWPDLEGDAARRSLAIAIHRLREALGGQISVQVSEQRVRLNERKVWVDAWAFEALANIAAVDDDAAASAVELYGGAFADGDIAWGLSLRERLRSTFIRLVDSTARTAERTKQIETAAELYRRGLEVEDLAEPFCRGLMRCCVALGREDEAVVAYRNFSRILTTTLGRRPSRDTEALYDTLIARD